MEQIFKKNRPNLSLSTIRTYMNILKNTSKKIDKPLNTPKDVVDNIDTIIKAYEDVDYKTRKTKLAGIISFLDDKDDKSKELEKALVNLRRVMVRDIAEYDEYVDSQKKSDAEMENWIEWDKILEKYKVLEKEVNSLWKLTKDEIQKPQYNRLKLFVLLSCLILIPPRRSQDWCDFKIRNVREDIDNYMKGKRFFFNSYKTVKKYGKVDVPIDTKLYNIINKWKKINDSDWLITANNDNTKRVSPPQITNMLNNFFDKKISVNMLRHSFLTHMYKNVPAINDMKDLAKQMSHDVSTAMTYVKKD